MAFGTSSKPVTRYPYVNRRLLVIDWASLSYHQLWSLKTKSSRRNLGSILPEEDELKVWRTRMFNRMIEYVKMFNPMDIVLCLEGKNAWRKQVVYDYYNEHAEVYYDDCSYYVSSDNYNYRVTKVSDDVYDAVKVPFKQRFTFTTLHHRKLKNLPKEKIDMLWKIRTASGTPILPSYKGKRAVSAWEFSVDKHYWQQYKDDFAKELAPMFRARAVKCDVAEGDDMIYGSVRKFAGDYDDIVIITRDSDMSQIDNPKVKIFNHSTSEFVKCTYPQQYLSAKVLSGDTSDNIRGMAFVDVHNGQYKETKGTLVSEKDAVTLLESCPNIYEVAKANGWADQYMRNRTLIDLSMVPQDVASKIDATLSEEPPAHNVMSSHYEEWGFPESKVDYYRTLQQFGFFCVIPRENVDPESFKGDELYQQESNNKAILMNELSDVIQYDDVNGMFSLPDFNIGAL